MHEPRDGDTRKQREVVYEEPRVEWIDGKGEVISLPGMSITRTVGERYCPVHGWVAYEGIIGAMICPVCAAEGWQAGDG